MVCQLVLQVICKYTHFSTYKFAFIYTYDSPSFISLLLIVNYLAQIVQKVHSPFHNINLNPVDSAIGFPNIYPVDGDLSHGQLYPAFEKLGPGVQIPLQFDYEVYTVKSKTSFSTALLVNVNAISKAWLETVECPTTYFPYR